MAPFVTSKENTASHRPPETRETDVINASSNSFAADLAVYRHSTCHSNIFTSLGRLETRMTADINVILQLLQRQIAPVPPAYSTVSSGTLPTDSPSLYGTGRSVLHSMYPISPRQVDSRTAAQVKTSDLTIKERQVKDEGCRMKDVG